MNSYRMADPAHSSTSPGISSKPPKQHGNGADESNQRHYFIPDDWAMDGSLDLCCMTADGTLIYPRDDKVVMIKASLNTPAFRRGSSNY